MSLVRSGEDGMVMDGWYYGWFKFDISSIPVEAIINSVTFNGYVYNADWVSSWKIRHVNIDPDTAGPFDLIDDITSGPTYLSRNEGSGYSTGWKTHVLGGSINSDLENALTQGWFSIGLDASTSDGMSWHGWAQTNVPYLEIDYNLPIDINAKVLLEGPFNGIDMNTDLNEENLIPLSQPYNIEPWHYEGTENVSSIPNADIVDWVLLEIREASSDPSNALPDSIIARKAAFLLKNGQVVDMDGINLPRFALFTSDNYYLVIWHRNHLAIMSSLPLVESSGTHIYDFTDQLSKAYNNGQMEISSGIFGMIGGDCDANGIIEIEDKNICWTGEAGKMGYASGDWDLNSQVNNPDKNDIWTKNLDLSTMVPDGIVFNPATGRTWMDRNLGASQVATGSNDIDAYGDLYQWGRLADGHEDR